MPGLVSLLKQTMYNNSIKPPAAKCEMEEMISVVPSEVFMVSLAITNTISVAITKEAGRNFPA